MKITDEMVELATTAACARYEAMVGMAPPAIKEHSIRSDARAAVEAVAPLIAAQALAEVDAKQGDVPYIDRGGVPYVEREHMFDTVNQAGKVLLGDDYWPVITAEVERRRAAGGTPEPTDD